jgi:hypothetical protein
VARAKRARSGGTAPCGARFGPGSGIEGRSADVRLAARAARERATEQQGRSRSRQAEAVQDLAGFSGFLKFGDSHQKGRLVPG